MSEHARDTNPALQALAASGLEHEITRHGRVGSLAEAAEARGVSPAEVIKTMVVRRGEGDHLLVLVPGDRTIAWPKLRELLGVSRLSMPDGEAAFAVTGFRRGTITPFGTTRPLPVVADERVLGHRVSIGGGDHGVAATVDGDALVAHLGAQVADVTDPEAPR
ncbi:YbaK/EbsC family protein [Agrococcus sediminis]|uniref:YbaK/EbsC family protein n=1 Tax=Agrococcus sediminis TaxID=2599924 RepID=A0A5M8QN80_9MICO|nr:YbaK/EbsC family protein [Agrococcus sediminis]KAA6436166.1 YbaK/EbsC family protein [Agrococcus sediminis]